jgi:hypothetical protein
MSQNLFYDNLVSQKNSEIEALKQIVKDNQSKNAPSRVEGTDVSAKKSLSESEYKTQIMNLETQIIVLKKALD